MANMGKSFDEMQAFVRACYSKTNSASLSKKQLEEAYKLVFNKSNSCGIGPFFKGNAPMFRHGLEDSIIITERAKKYLKVK